MMSIADSLRGRWAAHPLGWVLLIIPLFLLVFLQEATTRFPSIWELLLSALGQHVVAGGFIVGAGALALRLLRRVPLAVVFGIWILSGVMRGVISGWFAQYFAGVDPQYDYRVVYWVIVTLVWMPLFTYLLAHFELRRKLLGEAEALAIRLAVLHDRGRASVEERTSELVAAVRDAVTPLIAEVRSTLARAVAEHDGQRALEAVGARLELAAERARLVIEPPEADVESAELADAHWSPLLEALAFSRSRPVYVGLLTSLAVAALFLPDSYRDNGLAEVLENVESIAVGGVVLVLGLVIARFAPRFTAIHAAGIFVVASAAAQATLVAVDFEPDNLRDLSLIIAIPLAFGGAALMLGSAVGLGLGNLRLERSIELQTRRLRTVAEQSRARDAAISQQLAAILHGPLLGRLSACIMALNFFLEEPEQGKGLRRAATLDGVRSHLELVAADLLTIGSPER